MPRPNILIILSDEQRWDTLGLRHRGESITPHLDRLAAGGTRFANAFSSCPVCGPARATIQTGRYADETGCHSNNRALPPGMPTMAGTLAAAGYETAYVGKWHLASDSHEGDHCYWTRAIPPHLRGGWRDYWLAADVPEFTSRGTAGYLFDGAGDRVEFRDRYRADAYTDYALDYLRGRGQADRPLLMMLSLVEPHAQPYHQLYQGPPQPARDRRHEYRQITYEGYDDYLATVADAPLPPDLEAFPGQAREFWPDYLAACKRVDHNVGRMRQALDETGLADDTIVLFASDHGCHFFSHHPTIAKCTEHESSIHIPLLAAGPTFAAGQTVDTPVGLADLLPTVLAAAGLPPDPTLPGEALQRIADGACTRDSVRIDLPGPDGRTIFQGPITPTNLQMKS